MLRPLGIVDWRNGGREIPKFKEIAKLHNSSVLKALELSAGGLGPPQPILSALRITQTFEGESMGQNDRAVFWWGSLGWKGPVQPGLSLDFGNF